MRSITSPCTDPRSVEHHRRRRGTADIELLLSTFVMITLLLLGLGVMYVANARIDTANQASYQAFSNATTGQTPMYTDDSELPPIDGIGSIRPGLPNRTHVPRPTTQAQLYPSKTQSLPPVTVGAKAGLASPSWTFSGYPVGRNDEQDTQQWFLDDASDSHTWLTDPLRLAPAWTP